MKWSVVPPVHLVFVRFLFLFLFASLQIHAQDSVSFSTDIAPVLADRCSRCHGGNRPRRGLRIESFGSLMKGSENGEVVDEGDAESSLIILKMKGEADGDRMPPNGNALSDEVIAKFANWINAGAKFDGKDPSLELGRLASATRLSRMSEKELATEAVKQATKKWMLAFSGETPETKRSKQFLIVARKMTPELEELAGQADEEFGAVTKLLGLPKATLRSPLTVFSIPKRYDFAEFTQMVEKRDVSSGAATQYWRQDDGLGYLVLGPSNASANSNRKEEPQLVESENLRSFVASMVLNRWGAPKWYADGLSFLTYEKSLRKSPAVKNWKKQAPPTLKKVKSAKEIFEGRLPSQESNAATWAWAKYLARDAKRMRQLHLAISKGNSFERSFTGIYGKKPDDMCDAWLKWLKPKKKKK